MEIINVRVVPNSGRNEIKELENGLKVYLTAPPVEGKANKALVSALAEYFGVKKSQLEIVKGAGSRNKSVRITRYMV